MEIAKEKGDEIQNDNQNTAKEVKSKSCKGCVYYSSALKSKSLSPRCVGISRPIQVHGLFVSESEMQASKEGRDLSDFKYGCLGYSMYFNGKDSTTNTPESKTELPVCVGLEFLMIMKDSAATDVPEHVSAPIHNNEDGSLLPRPLMPQPAHTTRDDFRTRFIRSAGLVSAGVAKNLVKVGNRVKNNLQEILYPYRSSKPK